MNERIVIIMATKEKNLNVSSLGPEKIHGKFPIANLPKHFLLNHIINISLRQEDVESSKGATLCGDLGSETTKQDSWQSVQAIGRS